MKKLFLGVGLIFLGLGCSSPDWLAKIYVVRAEEASSKAHALRVDKKVPYEARLKYYHESCEDFFKAYRIQSSVFTLFRIETAMDSCLRVEDFEKVNLFRKFEEEYVHEHPQEAKYGDVGPWMTVEG